MRVFGFNSIHSEKGVLDLSPQQIHSCKNRNCYGGSQLSKNDRSFNLKDAFEYISEGGLMYESYFPYTSKIVYRGTRWEYSFVPKCKTLSEDLVGMKIDNYCQLNGEKDVLNYVLTTGPVTLSVHAEKWHEIPHPRSQFSFLMPDEYCPSASGSDHVG